MIRRNPVVYCGLHDTRRVLRVVNGNSGGLNPRLDLGSYATSLAWGYRGPGALQLALALAADATGDDRRAMRVAESLSWHLVRHLGHQWSLTREEVVEAVEYCEQAEHLTQQLAAAYCA